MCRWDSTPLTEPPMTARILFLCRIWCLASPAIVVTFAEGQTIQLPAFSQSGVHTTVLVPNGGSVSVGGFSHMRQSRLRYAPPFFGNILPNRSITSSRGAGQMSVNVWVHDLQAMDRALLAAGNEQQTEPKKKKPPGRRKPRPQDRLPPGT